MNENTYKNKKIKEIDLSNGLSKNENNIDNKIEDDIDNLKYNLNINKIKLQKSFSKEKINSPSRNLIGYSGSFQTFGKFSSQVEYNKKNNIFNNNLILNNEDSYIQNLNNKFEETKNNLIFENEKNYVITEVSNKNIINTENNQVQYSKEIKLKLTNEVFKKKLYENKLKHSLCLNNNFKENEFLFTNFRTIQNKNNIKSIENLLRKKTDYFENGFVKSENNFNNNEIISNNINNENNDDIKQNDDVNLKE